MKKIMFKVERISKEKIRITHAHDSVEIPANNTRQLSDRLDVRFCGSIMCGDSRFLWRDAAMTSPWKISPFTDDDSTALSMQIYEAASVSWETAREKTINEKPAHTRGEFLEVNIIFGNTKIKIQRSEEGFNMNGQKLTRAEAAVIGAFLKGE